MIDTKSIFEALKAVINRAVPELFVTAEPVANASQSYAHIQFRPLQKDNGYGDIQKRLRVTIQVVLCPELAEVPRADLYNISDAFDEAFCGYLPILPAERFITIYETESSIFDSILTYSFILSYSDHIDKFEDTKKENYKNMEELIWQEV